jgi:hypothetical protein
MIRLHGERMRRAAAYSDRVGIALPRSKEAATDDE